MKLNLAVPSMTLLIGLVLAAAYALSLAVDHEVGREPHEISPSDRTTID